MSSFFSFSSSFLFILFLFPSHFSWIYILFTLLWLSRKWPQFFRYKKKIKKETQAQTEKFNSSCMLVHRPRSWYIKFQNKKSFYYKDDWSSLYASTNGWLSHLQPQLSFIQIPRLCYVGNRLVRKVYKQLLNGGIKGEKIPLCHCKLSHRTWIGLSWW